MFEELEHYLDGPWEDYESDSWEDYEVSLEELSRVESHEREELDYQEDILDFLTEPTKELTEEL